MGEITKFEWHRILCEAVPYVAGNGIGRPPKALGILNFFDDNM